MGLLRERKPVDYVVEIGQKLAALSELPDETWTFQVVDTAEPNAFALPGGHVYVSRGLLALVNSEDELAGVIGHEIGHVTGRHSEYLETNGLDLEPRGVRRREQYRNGHDAKRRPARKGRNPAALHAAETVAAGCQT